MQYKFPAIKLVGLNREEVKKLIEEYGDDGYYSGPAELIIERIPPDKVFVRCNGYMIGRVPKRYVKDVVQALREIKGVKAYVVYDEKSDPVMFADMDIF